MIGSLINSVYDYARKTGRRNNQSALVVKEYQNRKEDYNRRLTDARSLFNRNYYRTYIDNVDARNLMDRTQEQLRERTRAMYNSAVVTGDSSGAVGLLHRNNNKTLKEVETALDGTHQQQQNQAKSAYENSRKSLADYIQEAKTQRDEKLDAISSDGYDDIFGLMSPMINFVSSGFSGLI